MIFFPLKYNYVKEDLISYFETYTKSYALIFKQYFWFKIIVIYFSSKIFQSKFKFLVVFHILEITSKFDSSSTINRKRQYNSKPHKKKFIHFFSIQLTFLNSGQNFLNQLVFSWCIHTKKERSISICKLENLATMISCIEKIQ